MDFYDSMDFDVRRSEIKRKKSQSVIKPLRPMKRNTFESEVEKVIKENIKLEEEMKKMQKIKEENDDLRSMIGPQMGKAEAPDNRLDELSKTLKDREDKYNSLLAEFNKLKPTFEKEENKEDLENVVKQKEDELEKINHMNATYRAQLIELKISMSKHRDIGRFSSFDEEHTIKMQSAELELEEAQERIVNLEDKCREQESIIETLQDQMKYYLKRYEGDGSAHRTSIKK